MLLSIWLNILLGTCMWIIRRTVQGMLFKSYSNIMSFFRFVNKRAIYRLCIISLAHAPVHVTDFPVVNVHVDELSSARIWHHKLCATLSANVNKNYRLPIKVYYRICTRNRKRNQNNSWKPDLFLKYLTVNILPYIQYCGSQI